MSKPPVFAMKTGGFVISGNNDAISKMLYIFETLCCENGPLSRSSINWNRLFCESVSQKIAMAITSCNNSITIGIFGNVNNGKSSICFDIAFRAIRFHFNQFFLCVLLTAAGIDVFNKNFVFIHVGISLYHNLVVGYSVFKAFQIVAMPTKYHFSFINMDNLPV